MGKSKIEWTDRTWNPVRGCSRVSEGCRNCYAERFAARFSGPGESFAGFATMKRVLRNRTGTVAPSWTGKVELVPDKLDEPLRWKKACRIFVNSMSDLFHEKLPFKDIASVFHTMTGECDYKAPPEHTYQILTKRPERMIAFFEWLQRGRFEDAWLYALQTIYMNGPPYFPRVWLGVSVEDQETADERIPLLLKVPAAKRFVSYEPALGPVDFETYLHHQEPYCSAGECEKGPGLDWVIVGGESGPGARVFDVAWARETVRQCRAAKVPAFVKQMGARPFVRGNAGVFDVHHYPLELKDRKGGDWSEWPEDLRVREFPEEGA